MTMKTLRERQRAERVAYVAALLAAGQSVRQAAKVGELDPATIRRLRRAGAETPILTAPASADTR